MKTLTIITIALCIFSLCSCLQSHDHPKTIQEEPQKILVSHTDSLTGNWLTTLSEATDHLKKNNKIYDRFIENGTMHVGLYQPKSKDGQHPHEQDEVYIIMQGTGTFQNGGEKKSFQPGDVIFVAAGVEHRFLDFSEDFLTWVVFYGPKGGEK